MHVYHLSTAHSLLAVKAEKFGKFSVDITVLRVALHLFERVVALSLLRIKVLDGVQRVKNLVFLHKPLNFIDHVLGALTVHILLIVVFKNSLDPPLFFSVVLFLDHIVYGVKLLRRLVFFIDCHLFELLLKGDLLLGVYLQFELSVLSF